MTREEAIQWLTNEKWTNANNKYKKEWNEAFDLAIKALQTLEAVERIKTEVLPQTDLLRCKDCRHIYKNDFCSFYGCPTEADGYCNNGERREE